MTDLSPEEFLKTIRGPVPAHLLVTCSGACDSACLDAGKMAPTLQESGF